MSIQLINWSGHLNLGDDAMAEILLYYFGELNKFDVENVGEKPTESDWYILGGGTLISPGSVFYNLVEYPEKTIGISLGVSCNWNGEGVDKLKKMRKIFTRDYFSHEMLNKFGVQNDLSVDLLCYLLPESKEQKKEIWANLMESSCTTHQDLHGAVVRAREELEGKDVTYFAMSPDEDVSTQPNATVFTSANMLLNDLARAKTIYATRLHANVLAWLSGCKDIRTIEYDYKIKHFFDRVKDLTPEKCQKIIKKDLRKIKEIIKF